MRITGVEHVVFGVDDMANAQRFAEMYGLSRVEASRTGARYEALDGSGIELRLSDDSALPDRLIDGPTSRLVIWGVEDKETLQDIGAELSRDREVLEQGDGLIVSKDDDGHSIGFRLNQRRAITAEPALANAPGAPQARPTNHAVDFDTPGKARALGHIVFWSDDPARSVKFYNDRLKFRTTDSFDRSIFARAASHSDHHSIFFIEGMGQFKPSFQHLEFQFRDFQEVMVGGKILSDAGWKTHMGPGRHVMGSNWYWYFYTPMGGAFELSADMDQVDDDWKPRQMTREQIAGHAPQWIGPGGPPPEPALKVDDKLDLNIAV